MDYRNKHNGLRTFLEHSRFLFVAGVALLVVQIAVFFSNLRGTPWIWTYGLSLAIAALGISLIFYAKLPLYRQRRFLTFGPSALPDGRRPFYRWGFVCVGLAVTLLLCLFLSRP
jgi:multisubunit Na+/H+ antiporter MnhB subunit